MPELSKGQALALGQLQDIVDRSDGALELRGEPQPTSSGALVRVRVSLATKVYRKDGGLPFRDRERLTIYVPRDFPFGIPSLHFDHSRFIGTPHVQWGRSVCLYQSPETEYDPADGMFGFIERVRLWMEAAGSGKLDPDDAPLHPPVAYTGSSRVFVARRDTPHLNEAETIWFGRADLSRIHEDRFDIVGWTPLDEWAGDDPNLPGAGALIFSKPLAVEYPSKVRDLCKLVENAGVEFALLYRVLRILALLTAEGDCAYLVLGAPMRRKAAGEPVRPHLTVWEIAPKPLAALRAIIQSKGEDAGACSELDEWLDNADVAWCEVMEDRPEIVHRRDKDSLLSGTAGQRVLLLGCGALGSAASESLVRGGAASLHLVDKGRVKPGLLVRQRFGDADVGLTKSEALKGRLDSLGLPCVISAEETDLRVGGLEAIDLTAFDLVIDATASRRVEHRIEEDLKTKPLPMPLISLSVSAAAQHGSVTVRMPGFAQGPHGLARQAKLALFDRAPQSELARAFWPETDVIPPFQPEPGCSEATFVGSVADIDFHAAALLNLALLRTQNLLESQASVDLISAPWLSRIGQNASHLDFVFNGYREAKEKLHGYTVLQSPTAERGMNAELRRIARTRSDRIETGGLLFGEVDDAHGIIWIDSLTSPPPDSEASTERFLCGVAGTQTHADQCARSSGGSSRFIGIWHTHPVSRGRPSDEDLIAMVQLLHLQELSPRQVVMLIVGFSASLPERNYYLYRRDEFEIIVREPGAKEGAE